MVPRINRNESLRNLTDPGSRELKQERERLDVVIPVYNEEQTIEANLRELRTYLKRLPESIEWRVVLVNDGSSDNTGKMVQALAVRDGRIHIVHHARNRGLGAAIRTGIAHATGNLVVTLDADLSYAPEHIARLIAPIRSGGAELVLASAYLPEGRVRDVPLSRKILSRHANGYLYFICGRRLRTFTCMVRAYSRTFLDGMHLVSNGPEINFEILHQAFERGVSIVEVPAQLRWRGTPQARRKSMSFKQVATHIVHTFYWGIRLRGAGRINPSSMHGIREF